GDDAKKLFGDDDGDGILNIDEEYYKTDKNSFDTDGDGVTDGEEIFAGRDPIVADSLVKLDPQLVSYDKDGGYRLLRLSSTVLGNVKYSLTAPLGTSGAPYTGPRMIYLPFSGYAWSTDEQSVGDFQEFHVPFSYQSSDGGIKNLPVDIATEGILPLTPK